MSQTFTLPQPPDPVKAQQYAGQIRTLIALLAGAGVIGGAWIGVSQEQLVSLVTAAMTLASLVGAAWAAISSWRQKAAARAELAASARESASRGMVLHLLKRAFGGSARLMVAALLDSRAVSPAEMKKIKALLDSHREEGRA